MIYEMRTVAASPKKQARSAKEARSVSKEPLTALRASRAGDGARTHDSHVGNVALYH
jgi:hypothetical protein